LYLSKGEVYVKTLLERAKGTALDIVVDGRVPLNTMALISSHTEQIEDLQFSPGCWADIQDFLEANPGPLPLLGTLSIHAKSGATMFDRDMKEPLPRSLFGEAPNLKVFRFCPDLPPFLSYFFFPNLVSIEFATTSNSFYALQLFDFLEASTMLRTVHLEIMARIRFEGVPQERVVALPNVENFNLIVSEGGPGYKLAAHISCPSATFTSLRHETRDHLAIPGEVFPPLVSWSAIARHYTNSPTEEATLEIKAGGTIECKLAFRSLDATVLELCSKVIVHYESEEETYERSVKTPGQVFAEATRTIQNHPHIANIKRLHIYHFSGEYPDTPIANTVARLLKSLGPLDQLTIHHYDLEPYFHPFFGPRRGYIQLVFPPVKELTISHSRNIPDKESTAAIIGLAKLQHARGMPLERVVIRGRRMPVGMEEGLKSWVGNASLEYCGF
jgi:hypothetical protein